MAPVKFVAAWQMLQMLMVIFRRLEEAFHNLIRDAFEVELPPLCAVSLLQYDAKNHHERIVYLVHHQVYKQSVVELIDFACIGLNLY